MTDSEHLFWGGTSSSVSTEGAGRRSDWHRWENTQGLHPSNDGNGSGERFAEDFALMRAHGIDHVRLTLDWARIEPFAGRLDHEALEHVEAKLIAARDLGLTVWATLHDGSLPGWFSEDTDGFTTTAGPSIHWSRHVDRMAEMFDEYISFWMPMVDPIGWAVRSHHLGIRPPGTQSLERVHDCLEGSLAALFDAHRLLASGSTPVVGNFALPTLFADGTNPAAEHRTTWDQVYWQSWSRAITEGVLEWPWRAPIERADMANAFDAIAVGIASPLLVDGDGSLQSWSADPTTRSDAFGLRPEPKQLGEVLHRVGETLVGKDLIITGLGVEHDDDEWRSELFEGWLEQIFGAKNDGLPIRGVFIDPLIDGYSEAAGSFVDAGVFTRDRESKPSFRWIQAQQ